MIHGVSVGAGAAGWIDARARPAGHRLIGYGAGGLEELAIETTWGVCSRRWT